MEGKMFSVVVAVVITSMKPDNSIRVTTIVTTEKLASCFQLEFEVGNAVTVKISRGRSTQARQRIGIANIEEYKRSACEELTQ
jgi:hypothetical protein